MEQILTEWQAHRLAHLEYRQNSIKADELAFWHVTGLVIAVFVIDLARVIWG